MKNYVIKECEGFSKDEAFKDLDFDPNCPAIKGRNITALWKKSGKPSSGTEGFHKFIQNVLFDKTRNTPGLGVYIVKKPGRGDSREFPYKIYNNAVKASRKWTLKYQIREDELDLTKIKDVKLNEFGEPIELESSNVNITITKMGRVVYEADDKKEALEVAKKLTTKYKKSYSILPVKVPDIVPISAYCAYCPSKLAEKGKWLAIGINKE